MKNLILYVTGGLSNRVFPIVSSLEFAKQTGRNLFVYWPLDGRCNAKFEDLYDDKINFVNEDFLNTLNDNETECHSMYVDGVKNDFFFYGRDFLFKKYNEGKMTIGRKIIDTNSQNIFYINNTFLDVISNELNQKALRRLKIKQELVEKINYYVNLFKIDKSVFGVHARGTDFNDSVNDYIGTIKNRIANDRRILVCSDDEYFEHEIKNHFGDRVIIRENKKYVEKLDNNKSWYCNTNTGLESLKESIVDLYLLAKTDFLIYNNNSTFAQYAKILAAEN